MHSERLSKCFTYLMPNKEHITQVITNLTKTFPICNLFHNYFKFAYTKVKFRGKLTEIVEFHISVYTKTATFFFMKKALTSVGFYRRSGFVFRSTSNLARMNNRNLLQNALHVHHTSSAHKTLLPHHYWSGRRPVWCCVSV